MKRYNYTNYDLELILKNLQYKYKLTIDPEEKEKFLGEIISLKNYIKDFNFKEENDENKLLNNYLSTKLKYEEIKYLWDIFAEFKEITNQSSVKNVTLNRSSFSKKDILDITHDFYKSFDTELFHKFMTIFKKRGNHVIFKNAKFKEPLGDIYYIESEKETFIRIFQTFTADDILTSIHEYAHGISYIMNPCNNHYPNTFYNEILPIFFELVATDYIDKKVDDVLGHKLKVYEHLTFIDLGNYVNNTISLIKSEDLFKNGYTSNKDIKNIARSMNGLDSMYVDALFTNNDLSQPSNLFGYIAALELYEVYKYDKEKAINLIKQIILQEVKYDLEYFEQIKRLGIYPNLTLKKHHTDISYLSNKF